MTRHPAGKLPLLLRDARERSMPNDGPPRARGLAPGDIILVHSHARLAPRLIGFGQRLHHDPEFAYWTHAAVYVGTREDPDFGEYEALIEAKGGSPVRYVPLAQYDVRDYAAIRFRLSAVRWREEQAMRANAVEFLRAQLGKRYEYLADVNLGLWSLFGGTRFLVGGAHSWFCSDLAAASAMYLGAVWPIAPLGIMPADIAEMYGVRR